MFYPSEQGNNDNTTRVPAQHILDSEGFMESWAQNLSQPDLDEGKRQAALLYVRRGGVADDNVITAANIQFNNESLLAYSEAPGNDARQAANYGAEASHVRRSSPPAAPHFDMQNSLATQNFTPPNLVGESQDPRRPNLSHQASLKSHGSHA
jgi:hypothetical protein